MTVYTTNGYGPFTPPDTEIRLDCEYCGSEVTGDIDGPDLYGACEECRPWAAMTFEALVGEARDQASHIEFLQARVGWLEAGPDVQRSDEGWPAGAIAFDGSDAA